MQYKIIVESKIPKFNEKVQQMIDNGWVCQGGASVSGPYGGGVNFVQSMVKGESTTEERFRFKEERKEKWENAKGR